MYSQGDENADKNLETEQQKKSKTLEQNTLYKKAVRAADLYKMDMENQKNSFGNKIKSVSDDIKNQILDGITKNINQQSLIKKVLKDRKKILDKNLSDATTDEIKKQIKEEIRKLYEKEKYKIERIVRTESVNSSVRAQLLKYKKNDVKKVSLRTSHDPKVCPKCRNLEHSRKTWEVEKLLLLGGYILSSITHPQCRGVFEPILDDREFGNDIGEIKNVPQSISDRITRLTKEIDVKTPVTFVKDPDRKSTRLNSSH